MNLIVLHNPNDSKSIDFLTLIPAASGGNVSVLDFYKEFNYIGPSVSTFPSIVFCLTTSGDQGLLSSPSTWEEVDQVYNSADPAQFLIETGNYFNPVKAVTGFLTACKSDVNINMQAWVYLDSFAPGMVDNNMRKLIWQRIVANPASWLDQNQINLIQNYASEYGLPLV